MVVSSRTPEVTPNFCPVCRSYVKIEPSDPAGDAPCPKCGSLLWFVSEDAADSMVINPTCHILHSEDLDQLIEIASAKRGMQVVLDLSEVQYMASTVLGKLIDLQKKLAGNKGKLRIESLHPDLLEVFRVTRLDQVFDIGP